MKRFWAVLLAVLLLVSAAACSKPQASSQHPDPGGEISSGSSSSGESSDGSGSAGSGESSGAGAESSAGSSSSSSSSSSGGGNSAGSSGSSSSSSSSSGSSAGSQTQFGSNETVLERDAQGNPVKTEELRSDGTKIHRTYHAGALQKEEYWNPDGSYVVKQLDDNGRITAETRDDTDGTRTATAYTYHSNGTLASKSVLTSTGSSANTYYNQQGQLIKEETRVGLGDKQTRELTYHANGKVATETVSSSSGTTLQTTYNEAGVPVVVMETKTDGSKRETTYYENGNRKTEVITDRYGSVETWSYSADGKSASGTGSQGTYSVTYHDNGKTAVWRFDAASGAGFSYLYEVYTYDDEETLLTHTRMQTNGTLCATTYHADGSHTRVFTDADGSGYTEYWYGDHLLGGVNADGRAWGVAVPGADHSGLTD